MMKLQPRLIAACVCVFFTAAAAAARAQQASSTLPTQANQLVLSGRAGQSGSVSAQQSAVPGTTQSVNTLNSTVSVQGPFAQSIRADKPLQGRLSLREAVQRGLIYNLGSVGLTNSAMQAHGQMRVARSPLLPNLNASLREIEQQSNLAAQGLRIRGVPQIIGPFNFFDLRATLTQNLADVTAWNNYRSAQENMKAVQLAARDARDLVVLAVGGAYLQVLAAQARVESAKAQVETAKALFEQTRQRREVGLNPQLDVNRSQVAFQTQQQRLTTLRNDLAKQKINLARIIGLSASTNIELSDQVPYSPAPALNYDEALRTALATRADLKSADAAARAAEMGHAAARAERLPSLALSADYGAIGINPSQSHGTFNVTGIVRFALWQGGKTEGDIEQASAALNQRRAEANEIRGRIESDLKNAFLDVEAAASQLQVAESNQKVAQENLGLTRDRMSAGIADSVEVTQAQETLATANLDYITSLLAHNLAKLSLARALGNAEQTLSTYLTIP
jgi:outer membrane protein TolC